MNNNIFHLILAAGFSISAFGQSPTFAGRKNASDEVRQIRLIQDDAQTNITSKIYELKHVKATDIRPFVENAVKRYDSQAPDGPAAVPRRESPWRKPHHLSSRSYWFPH